MTPGQIRAIAIALADELERRAQSGRGSSAGIGAPVTGDSTCRENEESESMDPTDTATSGESSSPEQMAANMLSRSRAKRPPDVLRIPRAHRAKAERSPTRLTRTR